MAVIGPLQYPEARASTVLKETFTLALENADIHSLIETVARATGRNFIIDPRVKARVNIVSSVPITADKLYKLFLSVLQVHGFAAVPAGSFTKIVPMSVGVQSAVPVIGEVRSKKHSIHSDELVTEVIRVDGRPVQPLVAVLRPLLADSATISAELNSNSLIITDRAANIDKAIELVRRLVLSR